MLYFSHFCNIISIFQLFGTELFSSISFIVDYSFTNFITVKRRFSIMQIEFYKEKVEIDNQEISVHFFISKLIEYSFSYIDYLKAYASNPPIYKYRIVYILFDGNSYISKIYFWDYANDDVTMKVAEATIEIWIFSEDEIAMKIDDKYEIHIDVDGFTEFLNVKQDNKK